MPAGQSITIIGTGLLGTSLALAVRHAGGYGRVVGVARRAETAAKARATGAFDAVVSSAGDAVHEAAMVVVAVPLGQFPAVFESIAPALPDRAVVTDVGSTKRRVLGLAQQHLRRPAMFVGSHPMAGSEQQGPEAAQADLFRGKPCVLTPGGDTDPAALGAVESMWSSLGMRLLRMDAAEHDAHAATISHVPHLASVMLVDVATRRGGWELASSGFRDTTRLASSNPPMRLDILDANRDAVLAGLAAMREAIDSVEATLRSGDAGKLLAMLEGAKARRDAWVSTLEGSHDSGGDA